MIKQLVVAMSLLGFISCPVLAATTETKAKHSVKRLHQTKHRKVRHVIEEHEAPDYKEMAHSMPETCSVGPHAMVINRMTQSMPDVTSQGINLGRSMPNPCNPSWLNRVQFSGGINVDLGKFGNRNSTFMGENYQRISLNDAYINMSVVVNDWAKAFASISYNTATINNGLLSGRESPAELSTRAAKVTARIATEYSSAYSNNAKGASSNALQLEQAYATFSNFDMSPIFVQVGKQFQDFGRYEIHPMTRSLTQVISETLATSIKVGFIANGFNGSLYAFDDPITKNSRSLSSTNYGAALGYEHVNDQYGFDLGAAYLYNMIGVNDVAYIVNQFNGGLGYNTRTPAAAMYADLSMGPFMIGARYTTAWERFKLLDLPKNGLATSSKGAQPWAAGGSVGYGFNNGGKTQNVYLGYQTSHEAGGLELPKYRWLIGYGIELFGKNTNVGVEWDHDKDYNRSSGGNGNSTNLVTVRTAVKFG